MTSSRVSRYLFIAQLICIIIGGTARWVLADELWIPPTSQSDMGGLEVASNVVWPASPSGAVRLAWAIPNDLQTFNGAKLAIIPGSADGNSTVNVFICPAQNGNSVSAGCAGPFPQAFTGAANQLVEVEIGGLLGSRIGTPGATYLAVLAYTAPTTSSDHVLGLRFSYTRTAPGGAATLGANTFTGTQTAPAFVGDGSGLTNLAAPSGVPKGNGTVNSIPVWSGTSTLGTSQITQSASGVQLPFNVQLAPGSQGNQVSFGAPNSETGMTIGGPIGRSDIRFDGSTLRLVVGAGGGPPAATSGVSISPLSVQLPNNVAFLAGAQGNQVQFGSPNGETGMTISGGSGRADLRFDGTLKLLNGPAGSAPPATNGLAITTAGLVGVGTSSPAARLHVEGGTGFGAVGVFGVSANAAGVGVYARNLSGGQALFVDGSAGQARGQGGLVKAMIYVQQDGTILRCYNGITNSSTGSCGFTISKHLGGPGEYDINFGFQVDDRFISVTARDPDILNTHVNASFRYLGFSNQEVQVDTVITNANNDFGDDANFMIIVY